MEMNKRGQGLSLNAIILIILGVLVLVFLILGFALGWEKLAPWLNTDNNVDTIVTQCSTFCSMGSQYDFCSKNLTLEVGEDEYKDTCYNFSTNTSYEDYGIEECDNVNCN